VKAALPAAPPATFRRGGLKRAAARRNGEPPNLTCAATAGLLPVPSALAG
jgi:hypothetical protein